MRLNVKEYYFYIDSTPTHLYMKCLYKYPQVAFPYSNHVETSRRRGRNDFEHELLETGVFDQDRYFDLFVEYAKQSAEDILIQFTFHNRGPDPATLHVLPTLGPIWMPVNALIIRALLQYYSCYGDDFTVEWPHGHCPGGRTRHSVRLNRNDRQSFLCYGIRQSQEDQDVAHGAFGTRIALFNPEPVTLVTYHDERIAGFLKGVEDLE